MEAFNPSLMYFVVFSSKTAFFKLNDLFPECSLYQEKSPQLTPLVCLIEDNVCHVGNMCMDILFKRVHAVFNEVVPEANLLVLYYKIRNSNKIGAGIFYRDMQNFRVITVNPSAWQMIKRQGAIFKFNPAKDFFLVGQPTSVEKSDIVI